MRIEQRYYSSSERSAIQHLIELNNPSWVQVDDIVYHRPMGQVSGTLIYEVPEETNEQQN